MEPTEEEISAFQRLDADIQLRMAENIRSGLLAEDSMVYNPIPLEMDDFQVVHFPPISDDGIDKIMQNFHPDKEIK